MIEAKQNTFTEKKFYTGLTPVRVAAINPTRAELSKLFGTELDETKQEFDYITQDEEGNDKLKLTFWLKDENMENKYWIYTIFLTNKVNIAKNGISIEYINNVCKTTYTDKEENLSKWFTQSTDREGNILGKREYREALEGEGYLAKIVRAWLGKIAWYDNDTNVNINVKKIIAKNYDELRAEINGDYDTPFIVLLGVETDESDPAKQNQKVFGKAFLPIDAMNGITNGFKFKSKYAQKQWDWFNNEVQGEYGFKYYYELCKLKEYNKAADVATSESTKTDSKY